MNNVHLKEIGEEECDCGEYPNCPYCGKSLEDVLYHIDEDCTDTCTCEYCGNGVKYELTIKYFYTFKDDCTLNNREHSFKRDGKFKDVFVCENCKARITAENLEKHQIEEDRKNGQARLELFSNSVKKG